ncbi:MAG: TIGR02147 family protein [Fibrobacterales bacterium]
MNIFDYYNYRTYLKEYYEYKKSVDSTFTYRVFAKLAGIGSPSVYGDLVTGRRNMTASLIPKFVKAIGLKEKEQQYLIQMMYFTHAKTQKSKEETFEVLAKMLPNSIRTLTRSQREYYKQWYHVAIREVLAVFDVTDDFRDLGLFLTPQVSLLKVKKAMKLLQDLELIEKVNGFWRPKSGKIIGDHIDVFTMRDVQKQMIDLGKEAIDMYTPEKRNVSAIAMSVSSKGIERMIRKINMFRREMADLAQSDDDENQVYQLNLQFFPLTKEQG